MPIMISSLRRDTRYLLPPDTSFIDFPDPRKDGMRTTGNVTKTSASGLAFVVDGHVEGFPEGIGIERVGVRIGECMIAGDLTVRSTLQLDPARVEVGCRFCPAAEEEDRWMALISGIALAGSMVDGV